MNADWFYLKDGQQVGPCTPDQLKELVMAGKLSGHDLIWKTGMPEWVPVYSIQGLARFIPQPKPQVEEEDEPLRPRKKKHKKKKEIAPENEEKKFRRNRKISKQPAQILFFITFFQLSCGSCLYLTVLRYVPDTHIPAWVKLVFIIEVVAIGLVFGGLGAWAMYRPLIPTILGLLLYVGLTAWYISLVPEPHLPSVIFRVCVAIGLLFALVSCLKS